MKKSLLGILLSICSCSAFAQDQDCRYQLQGSVREAGTNVPLSGASLYIPELKLRLIANEHGTFRFSGLCPGSYRIISSATGFRPDTVTVAVPADRAVAIRLTANVIMLDDVEIVGHVSPVASTATSTTLGQQLLERRKGSSLGQVLEDVTGVTTLQTGSSISKPVIHGLHSNRILMLNNGVRQEGQQWGVEHAPEIDPFIASRITVIKGAEAVRYGGEAMGGVVIVEAPSLASTEMIHGEFTLVGASNGRSGAVSAMAGGGITGLPQVSWRVQGSAKRAGNMRSADYYLNNTALKENNFSAALGYDNRKLKGELYFSRFSNDLGIFAGAHIGSVSDLEYRLQTGRPPEDGSFTYQLGVPSQQVVHDLLKLKAHWHVNDQSKWSLVYGLQRNNRKEYDVRRGGRSDIPSLDMLLTSQTLDGSYEYFNASGWKTVAGISGSLQVNNNVPGTGVTPLIPNYDSFSAGIYAIQRLVKSTYELEAGVRYDHRSLDALGYDADKQLYGGTHSFNNFSGSAGGAVQLGNRAKLRSNVGSAWRSPTVNELYSNGLHHGVAAVERGLSSLRSEQSIKWMSSVEYRSQRLSADIGAYTQYIRNFIYLQPTNEAVVSLRGTFPVFHYRQTDATFAGLDVNAEYAITDEFDYEIRGALVRVRDVKNDAFLPWIPSDRLNNLVQWHPHIKGKWQNPYLELEHQFVARQKRFEPGSDYAVPPAAYQLWSLSGGTSFLFSKRNSLNVSLTVNNLTNALYKEYMNRFRYYAHDTGRNFIFRTTFKF